MLRSALLVLLASAAVVGRAEAATITFNNQSAWLSAVGASVTTINFEGIAPVGGSLNFADLVLSGVHFSPAIVSDPGAGVHISAWGSGAMLFGYTSVTPGTVTFSTPVTAFGFNYGSTACIVVAPCASGAVSLTLSSGDSVSRSGPMPPIQFIGVISTVPLTGLVLQMSPTFGVVDNFSFGEAVTTSPVPEPVSLVLFTVGLAGTAARWRRSRAARSAGVRCPAAARAASSRPETRVVPTRFWRP